MMTSITAQGATRSSKASTSSTASTPIPRFKLSPPLLNSASPWATNLEDLRALYRSPYTGAVTTRTSMLNGFPHDDDTHKHIFTPEGGAINSYGYSSWPLAYYLICISQIVYPEDSPTTPETPSAQKKPFIISVTGTPDEISECIQTIARFGKANALPNLWVEVNLSCPNIKDKPPPAYDFKELLEYVSVISNTRELEGVAVCKGMMTGIKTSPFNYPKQFRRLLQCLRMFPKAIDFITATNTLGNTLYIPPDQTTTENLAENILLGGLSGPALHSLALGNVYTIRKMLDECDNPRLKQIVVLGVGGVSNADGYRRMILAGAGAVGVGVELGRGITEYGLEKGIEDVLGGIMKNIEKKKA